MRLFLVALSICFAASLLPAQEQRPFRTDADGPVQPQKPKNPKDKTPTLDWYALVDGQFPPAGSAHAISGELIWVDHLERRFHLRVDRNDSQDRGVWDLPVDAVMLPYGAIYYHGSPAALQDIPLGTHLHGLFYPRAPDDNRPPPPANNNRKTPEFDFGRCFQLEDDFSYHARQRQIWNIDSVDLAAKKLVATLQQGGKAIGKPQAFDLTTASRVYQGQGFAHLDALAAGQQVLFNLTWSTLYGPGRILDVWLDESSRQQATAHQLEKHRNHIRERGLAGWVDAVDDKAQIVTVTFFGGVDPKLFDELTLIPEPPAGTPFVAVTPGAKPPTPRGGLAVARKSLMTYDPVNDRKGAAILEVQSVPVEPGGSGVQVRLQCDMLLEGYRPTHIVRFYPGTWRVIALPREEQFFGRE